MGGRVPDKVRLFRLVDMDNLPHILEHGMYVRGHALANADYVNIGDETLIGQRSTFPVPMKGKGVLGDYIPFYFAGHTPMLLNIKTGFRGIRQRPQHELVYVVSSLDAVIQAGLSFVFTDGHPKNDRIMKSHAFDDVQDLDKVDWETVQLQHWEPIEDDMDRMRRKQAEFLVKGHLPVSCIVGLIVLNDQCRQQVEELVVSRGLNLKVHADVHHKYFFP
ncbi:MAG: DUF4433 domain-containing protein [Flavobacteriales bacterium]|nr:DUF4433 domain-containing protein [Flavobacteriales bacterium]